MAVTTVETKTDQNKNNKKKSGNDGGGIPPKTKFGFGDLLNSYGSNLTLDGKSDEYLSKLRKILEDPACKIKISCRRLENGAFAFNSQNAGIVLIFSNSFDFNVNDIISMKKIEKTSDNFKRDFPNLKLINIIVVNEIDFDKYVQMAAHITNVLQSVSPVYSGVSEMKISDLRQYKIIIDTDANSVKDFYRKNYPHTTIPRCDIGFKVSIGIKKNSYMGGGGYDSFDSVQPLFAVAGYTDFIEENVMPGSPLKFTPIVHISDVLSVIPSAKMFSMALPIAAEIFIGNGLWKAQYFNPAKGSANIGNLILDSKTNKPWSPKSQNEITGFFNQYINPPFITMDIAEGKARIPGIEKLLLNNVEENSKIIKEMAEFLEVKPDQIPQNIANVSYAEIIGYVTVEKEISQDGIIDSRYFDYLNLVKWLGYQQKFEAFKFRYVDPLKRADAISEIANFTKTHISFTVMIDSMFAKATGTRIGQMLSFYNPSMNVIPTVSFGQPNNYNFQTGMFGNASTGFGGYINRNIYR